MKVIVNLNSIDDVKDFVSIVSRYEFDVDLGSGRYIIDAKSIMGVFSLDLSKNIACSINASEEECSELLKEIERFCI